MQIGAYMNKKLAEIRPYIKFVLQHTTGQVINESDIDILCNKGTIDTVQKLGNDYYLVSKIRLVKQEYGGEE